MEWPAETVQRSSHGNEPPFDASPVQRAASRTTKPRPWVNPRRRRLYVDRRDNLEMRSKLQKSLCTRFLSGGPGRIRLGPHAAARLTRGIALVQQVRSRGRNAVSAGFQAATGPAGPWMRAAGAQVSSRIRGRAFGPASEQRRRSRTRPSSEWKRTHPCLGLLEHRPY